MILILIKNLGKFEFCANYIYDEHKHSEIEINYINSGKCIMAVNHQNIPLHQGDCIFISPFTSHTFMVDGGQTCKITQLEFSGGGLRFETPLYGAQAPLRFKITNCSDVYESLRRLYTYYSSKVDTESYKKLFELELEKLFVLLLMYKNKCALFEQQYQTKPLHSVLDYLEAHFEQPVDFEQLSKENGISSRYLRKLFVQHMNFSPIAYVTMLRMERAKDLLKNTSKTISEIALLVGYNSFQYFSSIFKKKIGITPKEFRKQYKL